MNRSEVGPLPLMEYVKALEGKDNHTRGERVLAALRELGIEPTIQECRWPKIKNLVVNFAPGAAKRLLFSAHYDVAKGSPGANDNASGVAVLLGLCRQMRQSRIPLTVVFFDREEAWLYWPFRLGLLGSLWYVWKNNLKNIAAVYNLEFCGQGDLLAAWPVSRKETGSDAFKAVQKAAEQISLPLKSAHVPWLLFTSDHASFRLRGISDALTLSLVPASQVPALKAMVSSLKVWKLLLGRRPALPEPLCFVNTAGDTSSCLSEGSLKLMLSLLLEMVEGYRP